MCSLNGMTVYSKKCTWHINLAVVKSIQSIFGIKVKLDFFYFYILPLTSKLKDCDIFGVLSDEYYNYTKQNQNEWILRGNAIVLEMEQRILDKLAAMDMNDLSQEEPELTSQVDEACLIEL